MELADGRGERVRKSCINEVRRTEETMDVCRGSFSRDETFPIQICDTQADYRGNKRCSHG